MSRGVTDGTSVGVVGKWGVSDCEGEPALSVTPIRDLTLALLVALVIGVLSFLPLGPLPASNLPAPFMHRCDEG